MIAATLAICRRDLRIWISYRTRIISAFFAAIVSVTLFYYVSRLVNSPVVGSPDDYYGFVVTGTVTLQVVTATLAAPLTTLRAEQLAGTFERIVTSPFGPVRSVLAIMLFPLLLALLTAVMTLVYATTVFGLDLQWPDALAALPLGALGAMAFAPFGIVLAAALLLFKQTTAGASLVITIISLIAGLYFPVSLLPDWIEWTSDVQPFTPTVDLLRHVLVGTPIGDSVIGTIGQLVAFTVIAMGPALLILRAAVRRSRLNGTITEY